MTMEKICEPAVQDAVTVPTLERGGTPAFATFREAYFEPNPRPDPATGAQRSKRARRPHPQGANDGAGAAT